MPDPNEDLRFSLERLVADPNDPDALAEARRVLDRIIVGEVGPKELEIVREDTAPTPSIDWLCPATSIEATWLDDNDRKLSVGPCHSQLHLVWTFDWPIAYGETLGGVIDKSTIADYAYTDGWEIVCENGHRLASLPSGGDEYSDPCDVMAVMAAIEAVEG